MLLAITDHSLGLAERLALYFADHRDPVRIMPSRGWPVRQTAGRTRVAWAETNGACAPSTYPSAPQAVSTSER
jgi:hypothetical protein